MKKIAFILALLVCQFAAYATTETQEASNTGLDLTLDLSVASSKHPDILPGWESDFGFTQITNEITFGIDETMHLIDPEFHYKIVFTLDWDEIEGGILVSNTTSGIELFVDYAPDMAYQDRQVYTFNGALSMDLRDIELHKSSDGGVTYTPVAVDRENLFLHASIQTEYFDAFAYNVIPSDAMTIAEEIGTSNWIVTWPSLDGADQYDLEWTWVNGYTGEEVAGDPVVATETAVNYDFENNASRVRVTGNEYRIPMIYGDGYLLVRYRGVGRIPDFIDHDIDGLWNTNGAWGYVDNGVVNDYCGTCKITVTPHEDNNMSYSASMAFVEEGKRNTSITYVDGTMKPRQSVSQLSSQDELIVGSALYDFYGRPAIGVMGSPVGETNLGYIENLNMLDHDTQYDKHVFHSDEAMLGDCGPKAALPMSSEHSMGSAKYYSHQNPNQEGVEAFVPESEGFNFAQVHYTNDPTGRVRRSGGVGPDHQLDPAGHYTEVIIEAQQDPDEVDRFIGSEAADYVNYTRVITKDVHGQVSVTILDNMGRTVISYLEGSAPAGLEAIEGNGPETPIHTNLVDFTSDSPELLDQGILLVEQKIAVTDPAQVYTFNYDFAAEQFTDCLPPGFCFDCIYEIEFKVTPTEGAFTDACQLSDGTDMIESVWIDTVGQLLPLDSVCGDTVRFSDDHPSTFTLKFPRFGEYYVTKTLRVMHEPIEYYWDQYVELADTNCLIPYSNFLADALMEIDFSDCYEGSPCEMSFYYEYGTWEEYSLETGETNEAVYNTLRTEYLEDCENQPLCTQMRPILLADVSPGGQYGDISGSSGLSVFNSADPMLYSWRDVIFYEIDGVTEAMTTNVFGDEVRVNHATIPLSQFALLWKDWWAEELIGAHPEYETYRFCELYSGVFDYATDFKLTETYAEASAAGYITPVDPGDYPACFAGSPDPFIASNEDPLVTLINGPLSTVLDDEDYIYDDGYAGFGSNDYEQVCQYMLGVSGGNTLYEMASALSDGSTFGTSTCDLDAQWIAFRDLYLARRNIILGVVMEGRTMTYNDCVKCIGNVIPPCMVSCADYTTRAKRFMMYDQMAPYPLIQMMTDPTILDDLEMDVEADINDYCQSACETMADGWMFELEGCVPFLPFGETWEPGQATYDAVRTDLITVCTGGCGADYPFPSQCDDGATMVELSSFEEVIKNHLVDPVVLECTHHLIDRPSPVCEVTIIPALDTCACNKLLAASDEDDFEALYGFIPVNFCRDRAICAEIAAVPLAATYAPGSITWTGLQMAELADTTTVTDYGCYGDGCIDCDQLDAAITSFLTTYPTASIEEDPVVFVSYVNETHGTGFDYFSLMTFMEMCDSLDAGATITEGFSEEALDFKVLLNRLVDDGLTTTGTYGSGYPPLPEYFESEFHTCDEEVVPFYYEPYVNPITGALSFPLGTDIPGITDCDFCPKGSIVLTPESFGGWPIDEVFEHVISFTGIYLTPADLTTGPAPLTVHFHLTALVEDPEGGDPIEISVLVINRCFDVFGGNTLCENYIPEIEDDCIDALITNAELEADAAYGIYLETAKEEFIANYIETCRGVDETYNMNYLANRYHYTLMYYDRAGNLVKTVPPKGVQPLDDAEIDELQDYRNGDGGSEHYNNHGFVTYHYYNALNQPIETVTPDGGSSKLWYDQVGRLIVSQNARQAELTHNVITGDPMGTGYATQAWSYTQFDDLGRPVEMGEFVQPTPFTKAKAKDPSQFATWFNQLSAVGEDRYRNQVMRVNYSNPTSTAALDAFGEAAQGDIRNRVSSVSIVEGYTHMVPSWVLEDPDYLYHYAYDVHGNVRSHLQENADLVADGRQFFQSNYEYDLLSGLPHYAHFQQGKLDQYSHRYTYDADNRLKEVHTSKDGFIWDRDAEYNYRLDGKLARTELGEMDVQGADYAYTLQGWIKGLNSAVLDPTKDMGKDGRQLTGSLSHLSSTVAQDALAFTLDYYEGDYQSIDTDPLNQFLAATTGDYKTDLNELFNGNIAGVTTAMMDLDELPIDVTGTAYRYDQLHRFKESHVHSASDITELNSFVNAARQNMTASGSHTLGDYEVHVDYDPNGNITALDRRAYTFGATINAMDQFTYDDALLPYETNNRLDYVEDAIAGTAYDDIQNGQLPGNYQYHSDGALKSDLQEGIGYLEWYPNGKLKRVWRDGLSTDPDLYFEYGPMGNRILKVEMPRDMGGNILPEAQWNKTWYGMDANGVPMAIYQKTESQPELHRTEATIYGSKRHGLDTRSVEITEDSYAYSFDDFLEDALCGAPGSWYMTETAGTTHGFSDVDMDGNTDLTVMNATATNFRVAHTFNTIPTETYTVSFEVVAKTVPWVYSQARGCGIGGSSLGSLNVVAPGVYSYTFTANATQSRVYFRGWGSTGNFTLGNVKITGPGDVYGVADAPVVYHRMIGEKMYELGDHLGNVKEVITDRKILVPDEYDLDSDFVIANSSCDAPGTWFLSPVGTTTATIADVNADGNSDLAVEHPSSTNFLAFLTIATETGETYTVSFDILEQTVPVVKARAQSCSGGGNLGLLDIFSTGSYSYTFTATSTKTKLFWAGQGSPGGKFTLGSITISGPGDIYGSFTEDVAVGYLPDVMRYTDYYPYGMAMPGRKGAVEDYRYGINGQEMDDEFKGDGNSANYSFRMHDPRLSRFFAVDPAAPDFPELTPYQFAHNNPVANVESEGLSGVSFHSFDPPPWLGAGIGLTLTVGRGFSVEQANLTFGAETKFSWKYGKPKEGPGINTTYGGGLTLETRATMRVYPSFVFLAGETKQKLSFKSETKETFEDESMDDRPIDSYSFSGTYKFGTEGNTWKSFVDKAESRENKAVMKQFKQDSKGYVPPTTPIKTPKGFGLYPGQQHTLVQPVTQKTKYKTPLKKGLGASSLGPNFTRPGIFGTELNGSYSVGNLSGMGQSNIGGLPRSLTIDVDFEMPGLSLQTPSFTVEALMQRMLNDISNRSESAHTEAGGTENDDWHPPMADPGGRPEGISGPVQEDGSY